MDFICKDCGVTFTSAAEYSDHFERAEGGIEIIGCKAKVSEKVSEKEAECAGT